LCLVEVLDADISFGKPPGCFREALLEGLVGGRRSHGRADDGNGHQKRREEMPRAHCFTPNGRASSAHLIAKPPSREPFKLGGTQGTPLIKD
jgi:hypothetical protein